MIKTIPGRMTPQRLQELLDLYSKVRRLAQREELELLEEVASAQVSEREKDAQIKALADALIAERALSGSGCVCLEDYVCVSCQGTAALKSVGRL